MLLERTISGEIAPYTSEATEQDTSYSARIEGFLNKGWHLQGSPALTFNPIKGVVIAAHSIAGHKPGLYESFIPTPELGPLPSTDDNISILYRLLVGRDDRAFCAFVERKLNEGWQTHGSAALTFDTNAEHAVAGRVLIRKVEGKYEGWRPLTQIQPRDLLVPGS